MHACNGSGNYKDGLDVERYIMNSSIKNLTRNTAFILGFWGGLGLFTFLNYLSYMISYREYDKGRMIIFGGGYHIGFPY